MAGTESLFDALRRPLVTTAEPFLIPDIAPPDVSKADVFHFLRDLCDRGVMRHDNDGYRWDIPDNVRLMALKSYEEASELRIALRDEMAVTDAATFLANLSPAQEYPPDLVLFSDTTPSGILVEYSPSPRRFYRVNGTEVPSVTTVLGVLDKPALPFWGMKVGVAGVVELWNRKRLATAMDFGTNTEKLVLPEDGRDADVESLVALLTEEKLTVNHARDKAGDRGTNVHDAFEAWAITGTLPSPSDFAESERGYVTGLVMFLEDCRAEPIATEVMVGSAVHGFAGRYDIRLRLPADVEMVTRQMPVRQRRDIVTAGVHLSDLKTSKGVYATSHFRQLEAYEQAGIECGYDPTDARYVIHVDDQGRYEYVKSTASFQDFLAVLEVHKSNLRLKGKA